MSFTNEEIDKAISHISEIMKLDNRPQTIGVKVKTEKGSSVRNIRIGRISGFDRAIEIENAGEISDFFVGIAETSEKGEILSRLNEINTCLQEMKDGKDRKSRIKTIVDSFKGSQVIIQTALLGSQLIAWIMSNVH